MRPQHGERRQVSSRRFSSEETWTNYVKLMRSVCADHSEFPESSTISDLVQKRDVGGLLAITDSLLEQKYASATQQYVASQFVSLIRKYPFPPRLNPFNPEREARLKFAKSEALCGSMNAIFKHKSLRSDPMLWGGLHSMRQFIASIIGHEVPYHSIWDKCDFGPGASVGVHGNATNFARKLLGKDWSVSHEAYAYANIALRHHWQIFELLQLGDKSECWSVDPDGFDQKLRAKVSWVSYNKISFVPKTAKTLRSVAVEPLLNGFVQKGIDEVLRLRLKRSNLDLTDQDRNVEWARQGSLDDSADGFVTIDLSAASDSISIGLCREVLPPDWFYLLDRTRSKNYLLDGRLARYEKFCSMGNGFCFPLETLLFAAACSACGCGQPGIDFSVYGDDIIVRKKHADRLLSFLDAIGFSVNSEKTFLLGPFRESCGGDWFHGEDVRPFILDYALDCVESVFKVLNLTRRSWRCIAFFESSRDHLISMIPVPYRYSRPLVTEPADSGYYAEIDEFMSSPFARWNREYQTWSWLELHHSPVIDKAITRRRRKARVVLMIAALKGASSSAPFTVRRMTRTKTFRVPEWLPITGNEPPS